MNHTYIGGSHFRIRAGLLMLMLAIVLGPATSAYAHYTIPTFNDAPYTPDYRGDRYRDITRDYYRHRRHRKRRRRYYNRLNVHFQGFWQSLDTHHRRYHRNKRHNWGHYDSGVCYDWERNWSSRNYDNYNSYDNHNDYGRQSGYNYGSLTVEFYRNRGRRHKKRFYLSLGVGLRNFWRSLDSHHDRYHKPYGNHHNWGSYDSGVCSDWEDEWANRRYGN